MLHLCGVYCCNAICFSMKDFLSLKKKKKKKKKNNLKLIIEYTYSRVVKLILWYLKGHAYIYIYMLG